MKKLFLFIALSFFAIGQMWAAPLHTYNSGDVLIVDCSAYSSSKNVRLPKTDAVGYVGSDYKLPAGTVYAVEFTASVAYNNDANFIKTDDKTLKYKSDGNNKYNVVVLANNGQSYTWSSNPAVAFDGLTDIYCGQTVDFSAISVNVTTPTYTYYVKKGSGSYGAAVTSYTFTEGGSYTVKVEVRENGQGDVLASSERTINCIALHLMQNSHTSGDKGSSVAVFSTTDGTTFTAVWTCPAVGTYNFYVTKDVSPSANKNCDYQKTGQVLLDGVPVPLSLYGTSDYAKSCPMDAPRVGEYTFTFTLSPSITFQCDFPAATNPEVSFNSLPASITKDESLTLTDYVSSTNVTNPAYTFYVKHENEAYNALSGNSYTFDAIGTYTVKVEVREAGQTGEALDYAEQTITCKAYYLMQNSKSANDKGTQVAVGTSSDGVNIYFNWTCTAADTYYFYATTDPTASAKNNCDYQNGGNQKFSSSGTSEKSAYLYGTSNYEHVYQLDAPYPGEYQFVLKLGSSIKFQCTVPENTSPSVSFVNLPNAVDPGTEVTFAATSENVTNPAYTFYVKKGNGEYGSAVSSYTFNEGGTYTIKVEVREQGATGDALAYAEQTIGCTANYTVYFRNTVNWENVWIHLYTDDKTFGGNGVGDEKAVKPHAKMTLVENTTDYYEYTYQAAAPYTKVCFTLEEQNNYGSFWQTECSWSASGYDAENGLVLWTPDKDATSSINSCTYYNTGTWTAFAPGQPNVSFVNLSATIAKGSHVVFEAEAMNVTNPTYRFYVKQGEGEYGAAVESYDFNEEGAYTVKVEVRSNDAGEALATAEQDITCAIIYTVYFKNTMNWADVYVHFYADNQTFGSNGVGGNDALLQAQMEQVGSSDIYKYEYNANAPYTKICFTLKEQFNYGQFHNNECSWSASGYDAANNLILWVPNGVISHNINSCPYFDGQWFVYPSAEAAVAFISLPAEVENGQAINLANYVVSVNVADPAYTFYAKQGTDAYAPIANPYTFPASGNYTIKVEVRENGAAGDALAYAEAEITVPLIATEFFLAGSFNSWSTSANCFRKVSGDAEEATTKITINEYSNITFKVVESGNWIGAADLTVDKDNNSFTLGTESLNNIHLTPYAAGDYIFTLNLNTRLLTVTYPDGEQMPVPMNLYAAGQFNNWAENSSSYKFTAVGDVATLTLHNLEANHDYEFKLIDNGDWLGANYVIKYHYNWEIQFDTNTSENAVLKTFKAGDYILNYTLSTGKLTVTYPTEGLETKQVEILALADGYATFYSDKGWDYPSEVEAYYVSGIDDNGTLTMVPLQGYIPAWVPVILHATPDTYTFYECDDETWIDGNMLKGTLNDETIDNENVHYIMTLSNNVPGLYWPYGTAAGVGAFENKGGKAYLEVPVSTPVPSQVSARRGFPFVLRTATGIDEVQSEKVQGNKIIRNGQLYLIHEGRMYNVQGARVK